MKLLLDECVTNDLKPDFSKHDVSTVEDAGLKGLKNGKLLEAASPHFDVLVTVDQNLQFQQNLENVDIAIVVLKARRATLPFLRPLVTEALEAMEQITPGEIIVISR